MSGKSFHSLLDTPFTIGHDMGDSRGVTVDPDLWRDIYKPHYKRLFGQWHRISDVKIYLRTCGCVSEILPDLIECGLDIYNAVQISADYMDHGMFKERFGDKLTFYGGCYDVALTNTDTPEELVYETVKKNIMILSMGGGYIFAGMHNLPANIPESHLKAIMNAYFDCSA